MRGRGKSVEAIDNFNFNFSAASELPCKNHPASHSVGICPQCLKDRLARLLCSECGDHRISSCSDVSSSSYRNSCSTMEVGSLGRVPDRVIFLRRSASSCVEVKKTRGFWKIKRLFRKRKLQKGVEKYGDDDRSEIWVSDVVGVSRSRSMCGFRGFEDERSVLSSAKISNVASGEFDHRRSDFRGIGNLVRRQGGFPATENDFSDDSAFFDLKVEELSGGGNERRFPVVDERRKGHNYRGVWKWIFK